MTLAATATTLDAGAIGRISDHLDEPGWLRDLRSAWWERASTTPPPTGRRGRRLPRSPAGDGGYRLDVPDWLTLARPARGGG